MRESIIAFLMVAGCLILMFAGVTTQPATPLLCSVIMFLTVVILEKVEK